MNQNQLVLSPKGEFPKEPEEGSLWFECLSFTLGYKKKMTPLRTIKKIGLYCAGGRAGGRADGRAGGRKYFIVRAGVFSVC